MNTTITVKSHTHTALIRVLDQEPLGQNEAYAVADELSLDPEDGSVTYNCTTSRKIVVHGLGNEDDEDGVTVEVTAHEYPVVVRILAHGGANPLEEHSVIPPNGTVRFNCNVARTIEVQDASNEPWMEPEEVVEEDVQT